jgi:hypothetical protein
MQGLSEVAGAASGAMGQGTESADEGQKSVDGGPKPSGESAKSSGIGLQQLLLTILAPTLALIGIAIGILDSNSKEAAARKRDDQIRTAALILPFYQDVITAQDAVDAAISQCDAAFDAWFATDSRSAEEAKAQEVLDASCAKVTSGFNELNSKINQALLVSNADLEPVVEKYRLAQEEFELSYSGDAPPPAKCFPPDDLEGFSGAELDAEIEALEEQAYEILSDDENVDSEEGDAAFRILDCIEKERANAFAAANIAVEDAFADLTEVVQAQVTLDDRNQ